MDSVDRRSFIKTVAGAAALAAGDFDARAAESGGPVFLSTWEHGKPANDRAAEVFKSGASLLAVGVAFGNRALFDAENRPPGLPIQHKEVSGLVALNDNRHRSAVAAQGGEDRLGSGVVIPQIVMHELETPDQFTGLCRQRHHRVGLAHRLHARPRA